MLRKITNILYLVSDFMAWLFFGILIFGAVTFPFVGPIFDKMDHVTSKTSNIIFASIFLAFMSILCWFVAKRNTLAAFLLSGLLACLFIKASGLTFLSCVILTLALVFIGPVLLSFIEFYAANAKQAKT